MELIGNYRQYRLSLDLGAIASIPVVLAQ